MLKNTMLKSKKGFTLVELLIYIAILGVVLVVITGFFWNIALGYIKESAYQELQYNGRFALTKITQEIRRAKSIIDPLQGSTSNRLVLEMLDNSQEVFELDQGNLVVVKNNNKASITTKQVVIDNLNFANMSNDNDFGIVKIDINLSYSNPGKIPAYQADINLSTTVSLLNKQ